jgi:hypothetical protein
LKDYLRQILSSQPAVPHRGISVVREYLQARILGVVQSAGGMTCLAFQGGTALRFLYSIPRYSEDLDFALERRPEAYDLAALLRAVRSAFVPEGYEVELKMSTRRTVHSAFVKLPGLLQELGLAPARAPTLSIKIEVDTKPPSGAVLATTVIHRHVALNLLHHDRASLFAGKLHAILQRPYAKGRDVFDLFWYLGQRGWPEPNIVLLNAALEQTGWTGPRVTARTWRSIVRKRLARLAWDRVVSDVEPFLEIAADRDALTRDNALRLLSGARP